MKILNEILYNYDYNYGTIENVLFMISVVAS